MADNMNGESVLIFLLIIAVVIIIFFSLRRNSAKLLRNAQILEQEGQYIDAIDLYAQNSLNQAANMILRTPEASQVLALRRLEKKFSLTEIEKVFIQLARHFIQRKEPHTATAAFVLAKKPFAAAKVYIDFGGLEFIPAAVQIIDQNSSLIHNRDQAIRNLARHAYNTEKYMEAAELLRTIGADEEANTVLIAAANEMRKRGLVNEAKQYLTTAGRPGVAIQHYLREVRDNLRQGNIEQMRRSLTIAKDIFDKTLSKEKEINKEDINSLTKELAQYDHLLKLLDSARDLLRKKNTNQAIALYDELLESLGEEDTPTPILAEAALANEEKNPRYASELFYRAAHKSKSPRAKESFKMRAKRLEIMTVSTKTAAKTKFEVSVSDVEEHCIVCRMKISSSESLVRCPECGSPAHYSHLAEWLKIRGNCPVCKKKVKIKRPKAISL
jgi:tetratricopeptide (TPR) repeat protein